MRSHDDVTASVATAHDRAHPRYAISRVCDAVIQIDGASVVLPVRNLGAGGFAAARPTDFGIDKAIERGIGVGLACRVRVLDKVIEGLSKPVYRIPSHTGFRFEEIRPDSTRVLAQTLRLLAIGASFVRIIRPVVSEHAGWNLYHGTGPSDLWVATDAGARPRVLLSYRDGKFGSFSCRYEDGRFQLRIAGVFRDGRMERANLRQMLVVMAGAAAVEPSLHDIVREGISFVDRS